MIVFTMCSLVLVTALLGSADTPESLLSQYRATRTSIINQRGLAPGDIEAIKSLRDKCTSWTAEHDDFQVVAAELQLSMWIKDEPRIDILFQRLSSLQQDNSAIALAWAEYKLSKESADPSAIYEDLVKKFPDSPEIILGWVRYLDEHNRFTEGIAAIEKLDQKTLNSPDALELYSDLLFADNRFDESVVALGRIDATLVESDPLLSNRITSKLERNRSAATRWQDELILREVEAESDDLPRVLIVTSKGPILLELFEDHAPNTVANFISLVESGYYDGTRFHRVLPKFMTQGGDPNSREGATGVPGSGGPGYTIKDEHLGDDIRNHFAGSLSMAKTAAPDSGGSQFFLTHLPTPHLDGRHTVFGRIITGLDINRSLQQNDEIVAMTIVRKRDHEYIPEKIGETIEPIKPKAINSKDKPTLSSTSDKE